eukprot:TRINITY_DN16062_c0_g2_i1.p1 TRINITY_DN16062_c0_g2~~TRINITY_DN16062_c0_g2_i1.p1  ORF type:complete len:568 (+),score=91.35 TRINITY_DN16062_c0_g2_i1:85-1788(+)
MRSKLRKHGRSDSQRRGAIDCLIVLVFLVVFVSLCDFRTLASASLEGVYIVSRSQHRFDAVRKKSLAEFGRLAINRWQAKESFATASAEDLEELYRSGSIWPQALPYCLVHDILGQERSLEGYDRWRRGLRAEDAWEDVRHGRDAPRRPEDGWIRDLDHTPESLAYAITHKELWSELAKNDNDGAAYLVINENCTLDDSFSLQALLQRLQKVPSDWQIVFLGGFDLLGTHGEHAVADGVRRLYPWFLSRAAPYLITAAGAKQALETCTPLRWRLDCQLAGYQSFADKEADAEERIHAAVTDLSAYCLEPAMAPFVDQQVDREALVEQTLASIETAHGINNVENHEQRLTEELDAVIAWSMRLTDVPVFALWCPQRTVEGNTGMIQEARRVQRELAESAGRKHILEIGFNGGHSCLRWLLYSNASIHALDLAWHDYCKPAAEWLSKKFPDRMKITWGDSTKELPRLVASGHDVKYDLIFIDGGHDYHIAKSDLKYSAFLANPAGHTILMDDTNLEGPEKAWDELIESGDVVELERYHGKDYGADSSKATWGFSVGYYTEKAMKRRVSD